MSSKKSRHLAMQALVRGSSLFPGNVDLGHVDLELGELGRCGAINPLKRKRLLQVLHATRALDTSLVAVLRAYGKKPKYSLGKMLHQLPTLPAGVRGHLTQSAVAAFVNGICGKRNLYAHKAAAFPSSEQEVDKLVSEIQSCIAQIL